MQNTMVMVGAAREKNKNGNYGEKMEEGKEKI